MSDSDRTPGRRLTPTSEQLSIWRGYIETSEEIRSRMATRLQSESTLSLGDYRVLLELTEAPRFTLRSSVLAERIGWERSRLSHHLGRMEKRGLISRVTCAGVPHGVDVSVTDVGRGAFRASSVPHLRAVRELFVDALSPEQLAQLEAITASLRMHLG